MFEAFEGLDFHRIAKWVVTVLGIIIVLGGAVSMFTNNNAGFIQVLENPLTHKMWVRHAPGIYVKGVSRVTSYQIQSSYTFSNDKTDKTKTGPAINVRYNDGGTADISGDYRFQLPNDDEYILKIHQIFGSPAKLMHELFMQAVKQAVYATSQLMSSEEAYTKGAQFPQWVQDQLMFGVYKTEEAIENIKRPDGTVDVRRYVRIKRDAANVPMRNEPVLEEFHITVPQATCKEPGFDETIQKLIQEKRQYEQDISVAEATATTAQQEKLTAIESGKTDVMKARYAALKALSKAVESARKDSTVWVTNAEQALEVAKASYAQSRDAADGQIAEAEGAAARRAANKSADNALLARVEAYQQILGFYEEAWAKVPWNEWQYAPESTAMTSDGIPYVYATMLRTAALVQKDLNLDLGF